MEYLDFELPIKDLHEQLEKFNKISIESDVDFTETSKSIKGKNSKCKRRKYIKIYLLGKEFNYLGTLLGLIP